MTKARNPILLAAALGAVLLAAPAATLSAQPVSDTVEAGYWSYKIRKFGITLDTDYYCVKPNEVDRFFSGPCNRHHICRYPTRQVAGGKARFVGTWTSKNDTSKTANIEATGTYTTRRFTLQTKSTRGTDGTPIPALTLDAQWLGETCKPGAKVPH